MFHRIPVPTPFEIGRVNTYVAGKTIVDPGPNSDQSWEELVEGLNEIGLAPEDIEQVLITHPHLDHFGLTKRFKDRGATVYASPETAGIVSDFPARLDHEQSYFAPFFQRCGVEPAIAETVVTLPDSFLTYSSSFETDVELTAGDTLTVDGKAIRIAELAGHAIGELLFEFETDSETQAIVGDTVLGHVTPNPFLQPPPEDGGDRPRQVLQFNETLADLADAGYDRLLSGHGTPIDEPAERIEEIRDAHEERTSNALELVDGQTQPIEVMDGLFGDLPVVETFSGMSEAVGHLEVLEDRGEVEQVPDSEDIYYRPVESGF